MGTFVGAPTRTDWFLVGNGVTITAPTGGANLYLAVNDTVNSDNHGTYSGSVVVVPEANAACLIGVGLPLIGIVIRRKKQVTSGEREEENGIPVEPLGSTGIFLL